ncbi:MAG: prepilin-type N-terminal cleavage/methylation domain-containing protein [Thermoanaerobaculaceae bacterium]
MRKRGFSLLEVLFTLGLLGLVVTLAASPWQRLSSRQALNSAALRLLAEAQRCYDLAMRYATHVGLLFDVDERGAFFVVVRDANSNGVSRRDYLAGRDPVMAGPVHFSDFGPQVRLGPPEGCQPLAPGGSGTVPGSGLALGEAKILSFAPVMGARSGSIYLSAGSDVVALRVAPMGSIRLYRWNSRRGLWLPFTL